MPAKQRRTDRRNPQAILPVAAGDRDPATAAQLESLSDIHARTYRRLHRQAMSIVGSPEAAEDVVQEAFAKTARAIATGTEIRNLGAWLSRCVRNHAVNHLHERAVLPLQDNFVPPDAQSLPDIAHTRERFREISEVLDALTPAQRSAFLLAEVHGLSYREIGDEIDRSVEGVRQLLSRARALVRDTVGPETFALIPVLLGKAATVGASPRAVHALANPAPQGWLGRLHERMSTPHTDLRAKLAARADGSRDLISIAAQPALPVFAILVAVLFAAPPNGQPGASPGGAPPQLASAAAALTSPVAPGVDEDMSAPGGRPISGSSTSAPTLGNGGPPDTRSHTGGAPPNPRSTSDSGSQARVADDQQAGPRSASGESGQGTTSAPARDASAPPTPPRYAYVVSQSSTRGRDVAVLDTNTDTVVKWIKLGAGLSAVAVTRDGSRAYVTNAVANRVEVIDTASNASMGSPISVGSSPSAIAISSRAPRAYVANKGSDSVFVVDTSENVVVDTVSLPPGSSPSAVAVSPDGQHLFVANEGPGLGEPGTISAIDLSPGPSQNQIVGSVPAGVEPSAMAISPDGRRVYVANKISHTVLVIDAVTGAPAGNPVPVGNGPVGMAVMPDLNSPRIVVANKGSGDLSLVDGSSGQVETIPLTAGQGGHFMAPFAVAVTPDGSRAYTTHVGSGEVASVDLTTRAAATPIGLDPNPRAIAIVPNQGPTARANAASGVAGTPTNLDGAASSDADGFVAEYRWDFGDGSTATTTQPVASHVYASPGSYHAVLRVVDNEGGSASQIGDGRTLSQNGDSRAVTKVPVTVTAATTTTPSEGGGGGGGGSGSQAGAAPSEQNTANEGCASALKSQPVSVTHWKSSQGIFYRLMAAPGAHSAGGFDLTLQSSKAGKKLPSKVRFSFDGRRAGTVTKPPYKVTVAAATAGKHHVDATVYSKGTSRKLALDVYALNCEKSAFSVSMKGKVRSAKTDLYLRAQTAGERSLSEAEFTLPSKLRVNVRGLIGKRIGTLGLLDESGATELSRPLKLDGRARGKFQLAGDGGGPTASLARRGGGYTIKIAGLDRYRVPRIGLSLFGRRNGFLVNAPSCVRYAYAAALTTTDEQGQKAETQNLIRALKMCKGKVGST